MGTFKATKNKKEVGKDSSVGTFKATKNKSYDSTITSGWETTRKSSYDVLNAYDERLRNKEYLSADDLSSYKDAMTQYIDSTNNLRGVFGNFNEADEKEWHEYTASAKQRFDEMSNYFSRWKNEKEYSDSLAYQKDYEDMLKYDSVAGQADIDRLQEIVDAYDRVQQPTFSNSDRGHSAQAKMDDYNSQMAEIEQRYGVSYEDAKAQLSEKSVYHNLAERTKNAVKLASVAVPESDNYDPEFLSYSQQGKDMYSGREWNVSSFGNLLFEDNPIEYYRAIYSNKLSEEDYGAESLSNDAAFAVAMSDDEVSIYNYYLGKYGKEKAQEYLYSIEENVNQRIASGIFGNIEDIAALEYIFGVTAGLDQFASGLKNLFSDRDYIPATPIQMASGLVREDLAGDEDGFKIFGQSLGQLAYDAITTTSNMLPSIFVSAIPVVGSAAGAVTLGASAAGHAKAEMLNLGYSKSQANTYGLLVGASEAGLQYLLGGIGKLGGKTASGLTGKILSKVDNALARAAITIGANAISEGFEEGLQTVLEPWFKEIATGVDWESPNIDEILYSSLLGAISSIGFEGVGATASGIKTARLGSNIKKVDGGVAKLKEIGALKSPDTAANRLAGKVNDKSSSYQVGRLATEIGESIVQGSENFSNNRKYSELMRLADEVANGKDAKANAAESTPDVSDNVRKAVQKVSDKAFSDVNANANKHTLEKSTKDAIGQYGKTAAERLGIEGKYSSSNKGVNTIWGGKKAVNVVGVEELSDGEMMLKFDDGSVANASRVDFASTDEAVVYEAVSNMGVSANTAWEIIKGYEPNSDQSGAVYALGAIEAYTYGHNGIKVDGMSRDGFSSMLSPVQRNTANRLGDIDAMAKVNAKQGAIDTAYTKVRNDAKSKGKPVGKRKGETIFEGNRDRLTDLQNKQLGVLEKVSDGLGVTFHIFASKVDASGKRYYRMPDGKITSANGWYDPKTGEIWIDLYAGNDGQGTMIFTAAHELTHFIKQWSPAKFKIFADFLFEQYGKNGKSVEDLITNQIKKAAQNGRLISREAAYEEVVADSCETFLLDSNAAEKIAALREKDAGLANKIKSFIGQLLAKMRKLMTALHLAPETDEGKFVAEMTDKLQQLYDLWTDALSDAGAKYSVLADVGIGFDSDTQSVYSLRYSPARTDAEGNIVDLVTVGKKEFSTESIARLVAEATGRSIEDARKWVNSEITIANIVMNNPEFLDFEADDRYEAIKKNSDYPQGTVDLSNLCPKREEFTTMFDMLQKKYPNRLFTASDVAAMRNILKDNGITVACGACFVEDRRQLLGEIADTYINMWKEAVETGNPLQKTNASGNKVTLKVTAALAKQYGLTKGADIMATDTYIPTQYDLTTYEGFKLLEKNHPIIAIGFNRYNNSRGQQAGRLIEGRAEYNRQILGWTDAKIKNVNNNGGLRIFSFSDFEVVHLLDLVQVIIDCAAMGVKIQGYTKIPSFAKLVRNTGIKLNRSLIPKGQTGIKVVDGKKVLDIDTTEGIDIKDENFLDESDNPDVGNIIIGINPTQIGIAMLDDFIDYIIPFHTNKSKDICKKLGLGEWVNYKESQHEKDIDTGTASKHNVNIYTQVINKYHPTNKVEFVDAFLKECKAQKKIPRYSEFLNKEYKADGSYSDEYGAYDYTYREGYHKLLVDFKMFDKNGDILPQGDITPELDNEFMEELLKAEVDKKQNYEFPQEVYDRIDEEFGEDDGDKFSFRDSRISDTQAKITARYKRAVDKVLDGTYGSKDNLLIGYTPEIFQKLGMPSLPFVINAEHVYTSTVTEAEAKADPLNRYDKKAHYHGLGADAVKNFYTAAQDPIIIIAAKDTDNKKTAPRSSHSVVAIIDVGNASNHLLMPVEITAQRRLGGMSISVNALSTAYMRDVFGLVKEAIARTNIGDVGVYYMKKDATKLLGGRVSFPKRLTDMATSYNGIIHQFSEKVNMQIDDVTKSSQFTGWFGDWQNAPKHASKVVDDDGYPMIVYHGSKSGNIKSFRTTNELGTGGLYLTTSRSVAEAFAGNGGEVYETYVNLRKPLIVDAKGAYYDSIAIPSEMVGSKYAFGGNTVDTNAIAAYARQAGYDGVIVKNVREPAGFGDDIIAFESNQVKSVDNVGTFDNRKNNSMYSDRSPGSVSKRAILSNALESTIDTSTPRGKMELASLARYKDIVNKIDELDEERKEKSAMAQELRFKKGRTPEETKKMKELQLEASQAANRINTYDRQLLNLESTAALKNVLQREKNMARKKAEQKNREAIKKEKEKRDEKIEAIMQKNREARERGIESRSKTEMRGKIKSIVSDLNTLLLNPTKEKHVPIGLQKPVAAALDVINMDTVGAEERIAKYDALIAKATDPDVIASLKKSRNRIALQGETLSDRLASLKAAYAEIKNSDDPLVKNSHNEAIESLIDSTIDKAGNTSLRDMSIEQLEAVYDMFKAIKATVRNANKMFKESRQETVTENSEAVKTEVMKAGGHRDRILKATKWLKKVGWDMLKPLQALRVIGSDTLSKLFENVRKGEDTWAVDVNEAKTFFKEKSQQYGYNSWDFKKRHSFKDSVGNTFSLSLEQIMSLYAYSKREQADRHLEVGGFIFDDAIEVTEKGKLGIPMKYEVNDANPYRLGRDELGAVVASLTSEQRGFIDEMQTYLSDVMGEKGNEVSLAMYDIKLYKEKNYFPLKTARYFREFDPEKNGTPKIKNSGFSKKTVPQAGNPIVLSNFMDVWANHVNDMSMYHAFVLPLEDFMRVYNYSSTAGGYDSVQQYIKNAYGSQANQYVERLMEDLNGGARVDPTAGVINKGIGLFKKSAVFASASVVIQQPSAIARALAYVNAKYFIDKPELTKHSETWAEVKKYAPVAIIKEMGYFDTNMGRSTVDWIKDEKTFMGKIDDIASKAPALADELAWCAIWKAVKREVAATTNLKAGSEEFLKMAGERFTEVVTNTQVYDSVLSRSGMMRSKDTGMKMATAFMAEPTTAINMVVDAIIQGKRGNKKFASSAIGAVAASVIINSILVSLVYAARDDDEDETYTEKYLASLTTELIDGFNPLTYIPFVKDIWSIMQGFDVERSDMSVVGKLWESIENLFNNNKSGFEKVEGVVGSIASIFGLPVKNLMRDARGLYNFAESMLSDTPTTKAGISDAVSEAAKSSVPLWTRIEKWAGASDSKSDKLYDAIMSGDEAHIERIKAQFDDGKKTDKEVASAIDAAIRKGLRENDPRIKEAAQAVVDGNASARVPITKEILSEGNFEYKTIVAAINAEIDAIRKKKKEKS